MRLDEAKCGRVAVVVGNGDVAITVTPRPAVRG
jgi:hypothetical protein